MKLLLVEDDKPLLEGIVTVLKEENYDVESCLDGEEGLYLAKQNIYDAIILDIMLPSVNGLTIVKTLRNEGIQTPILLLTAKDSVEDRVRGLDVGADDYLVKPFAVPELLARVRVLLRAKGSGNEQKISYGPLWINKQEHDGYAANTKLNLTVKEYELLEYFILNQEQILPRDQILNRIWGLESEVGFGVVDVYVHHLRKKLGECQLDHYICTIRGIGFMLKGNDDDV
ncbi:response regulator transcription factor [Ectobacillus polymachus]|uniref:response regulator transcription factor n=1 Tax=Ectobacillus polymachus TaxID=1508806 RepID=UPI003A8421B8